MLKQHLFCLLFARKCSLLTRKLDHIGGHTDSRTCTKATTTFAPHTTPTNLPADMRIFPWCIMKSSIKTSHVFLGKGVFGKCYLTQLGPMKVCVKVYHVQRKYSETFFNEVWILHMLVHDNLPLLLGVYDSCKNPKMTVMSYHSFNVQMESLTIHTSLKSTHLTKANWKQVLLGCISALCYLVKKQVIHNDIKADNVLVEYLAPEYKQCRSVLIDFGKACCVSEAKLYHLSPEEKEKYKVFHPQIAPEVHNGIHKQSFASDIYSFGRIMQRVNHKLEIPVLNSLADQCLGAAYDKRPSAQQLLTFLSNLFEE